MVVVIFAYLSPVLDFGLGNVLDRHLESVPVPDAGVHDPEAALAQDLADLVGLLERLPQRRSQTKQKTGTCKEMTKRKNINSNIYFPGEMISLSFREITSRHPREYTVW